MTLKHKLLKDYHLVTNDKKVIILKSGSILNDYKYVNKSDNVKIDPDIVRNNPDFFELIVWQTELLLYVKQNKIPQPSIISKKLIPFIDDLLSSNINESSSNTINEDEYNTRMDELLKREINYDSKYSILLRKEADFENETNERLLKINEKEFELNKKINELQELSKKEKDIDDKIKELNKLKKETNNSDKISIDDKIKEEVEKALLNYESKIPHQYHRRNIQN